MNWSRLKNNRCPQCNGDMAASKRCDTSNGPGMTHSCGFTISDVKFSQIVSDKIKKELLYPDAPVQSDDFL